MTSDEAKAELNERLFGKPCNTPEQAKNLLDEIWQAALEWAKSGQEPVAWRWETQIPDSIGVGFAWSFASHISTPPKDSNADALFLNPAPAQPAVVQQLVEALRIAVDTDFGAEWRWPESAKEQWLKNAKAALKAVKGE